MKKKLASFVVDCRFIILAVMLVLAIGSAFFMQKVEVNEDMTKYLPDDSAMKVGMDIMTEEFPEMETSQTIRVMFDDLTAEDKESVLETLQNIEYVDSVSYDADSADYNVDNHTLFVINSKYEYGSEEMVSIENVLDSSFSEYTMTWANDDTGIPHIPTWILLTAVGILMVILFVMCGSWIEPILFLVGIGFAVVINMGTNYFLGSVSGITSSISSILQLILSMDYSIILINRYKQEKAHFSDNKEAMKAAVENAFSSIVSSGMTTVIGLLMLVFMSFKIGMDLGIVLAKGVLLSMICVLVLMPGIIIFCDKLIQKTAKKELHIPMNWAGKLSHKMRYVISGLFVVLMVVAYILQQQTGIVYTLQKEDKVAEIFQADNTLVLVYDTKDENAVSNITKWLEDDENVKSVLSYYTMLGALYTTEELADVISEMSDEIELGDNVIKMFYYDYYMDGKTENMTAGKFLNFITDVILTDETFKNSIDEEILESTDLLERFADKEELTRPMNAEELAEFFDMEVADIKDLFLYYYIENGGIDTGTMTLATFTDFVLNEVAVDETYGSMFDEEILSQMKTMSTYTNASNMTTAYNYKGIASILGMDEETTKLVFIYYYALSEDYVPEGMQLAEFVSFIQNDVASNPNFASAFDAETLAQINMLAQFTNVNTTQTPMTASQLAALLGLEEAQVNQIFTMYFGAQNVEQGITYATFMNFLVEDIMNDPVYGAAFDDATKAKLQQTNALVQLAASGQSYTATEMNAVLTNMGMNLGEQMVTMVYAGADSMTLPQFLGTLCQMAQNPNYAAYFDAATIAQLQQLYGLVALGADTTTTYHYSDMAAMLGMESEQIKQLYVLYWGKTASNQTMSLETIINFLLTDSTMSASMDKATLEQLGYLKTIMDAAKNGTVYSYSDMGQFLGMDASMVKMLYTYHDSLTKLDDWKLSMYTMINFLVGNSSTFEGMMDADAIASLQTAQKIINGSVAGVSYSSNELASLLGMSNAQANQLYTLYVNRHGDTSEWKLSVKEFIDFIIGNVLNNDDFKDRFDEETSDMLIGAQKLVNAIVSDESYSASQMSEIMSGLTEKLDASMIELVYLYASAVNHSDESWTMTTEELFNYLVDVVLVDERFSDMLDEDAKAALTDAQTTLEDGKKQLISEEHSRMIITTGYPAESEETYAFISSLSSLCDDKLTGDYYFVGNSAMNYEMSQTFDEELMFITILTAVVIYIIVAISSKSLIIPLILVLIVQTGVYITVSTIGLQGNTIYYLALLIVQCILMGATIDYGILYTNYYVENRKNENVLESLKKAYEGAIHTIATSGLILVIVTAIVGNGFKEPTVAAIVKTLSIGSFVAIVLILFILPGVLACCDKLIIKKNKKSL